MKTTIILSTLLTLALSAPTSQPVTKRQNNLQTFAGALGGIEATPIEDSGNADRPFQVKGDTFVNIGAAVQRSCDQQFNACANAANGGDATLDVGACSDQKTQCAAEGQSITGGQAAGNANGDANDNANGNANNNAAAGCNGAKKRRSVVKKNKARKN